MTTNKNEVMENIFDEERIDDNMFAEEYEKRNKKMDKPTNNRIQENIQQEDNIFDEE